MKTALTIKNSLPLPKTYRELCLLLLPRAIHDDAQYRATQKIVDALALLPSRTRDQADYLETLSELMEAYEEFTLPMLLPDGLATLKHLLEENGWNGSDLSRLLGKDISLGYRILTGERKLTTAHIRKLAEHFAVSAEVFF